MSERPKPTERGWELVRRFRAYLAEEQIAPTLLIDPAMARALERLEQSITAEQQAEEAQRG